MKIAFLILVAGLIVFIPFPRVYGENQYCDPCMDDQTQCPICHNKGEIYFGPSIALSVISMVSTVRDEEIPQEIDPVEGRFCGGIAANLPKNQCPTGYACKLDGDYPDAGGKCTKNQ